MLLSAAFRSLSRPSSPYSSIGIRHEPIFRLTILSFLFPRISFPLLPHPAFTYLCQAPRLPSLAIRGFVSYLHSSLSGFTLQELMFLPFTFTVKELSATFFQAAAFMEQDRVELSTPALSERCSNQLSYCSKSQLKKIYIKNQLKKKRPEKPSHKNFTATVCTHTLPGNFRFPSFSFCPTKGGDPAALSSTATLLRLHPPHEAYLRQRPPYG